MSETNNVFTFPVRVYYEDTDAGGVVYNANYVKFLERARTEWLRSQGVEQLGMLEEGIGFVVSSLQMSFLKAAKLDAELFVSCKLSKARSVSVNFEQTITDKEGNLYITAEVKIACVDLNQMKPRPIPEHLKGVFVCE
jgi:acyl-CoA thioester hydrolase